MPRANEFCDTNGNAVHAFAGTVENLGFRRLTDALLAMLESKAWMDFKDGLGRYQFLEGEYDYFLTQWGVTREDVIHGVRDIDAKAKLDAAMDERRTGEHGYRRCLDAARNEIPNRPGSEIVPFGWTKEERKRMGTFSKSPQQPALGAQVRKWVATNGQTSRAPSELISRSERLTRTVTRNIQKFTDDELKTLMMAILDERVRRYRN